MHPRFKQRVIRWAAVTLASLMLASVLLIIALALLADHLREPLIRLAAAQSGRQIQIRGAVHVRLFSRHPGLVAQDVVISNPPWTPPGTLAEIGRLSLTFDLPLFGESFAIHRLEAQDARLHLWRDAAAGANWQWSEPDKPHKGPPLIRSLSMPAARTELNDARRHLQFAGTVTAREVPGAADLLWLNIVGAGRLNQRPATFAINGDPLANVSREHPYHFAFDERSSGARLSGRGTLPRPFDFRTSDTTFEATGADLKDLYRLTGLTLLDTGPFRLSGHLARRDLRFTFSDLAASSGSSDVRGTVAVDSSSGRPKLEVDLNSQLLRAADLGPRAAQHEPETHPAKSHLLSDKALHFQGMRGSDAAVRFHARSLQVGHLTLHAVAVRASIEGGVLRVDPLSAALSEGKLTGQLEVNAIREVPAVKLDLRVNDLRLSQFAHSDANEPPIDGVLRGRVGMSGRGASLHDLASSANGTVTAVMPQGAMRKSLAELTGLDLRGLGLLLAKNKKETVVRCGVASFEATDGVLHAKSLVLDTDPVLITGKGDIDLHTETVDLTLQGHPKHFRLLRVRAPVNVRGPLAHPKLGVAAGQALAQAGGAVALGIVLSPLAAILAFVDPGLAKDADCGALLAQAQSEESGKPASSTESAKSAEPVKSPDRPEPKP